MGDSNMDLGQYYVDENKLAERDEMHLSPSRKYLLQISVYNTLPNVGAVSKGVISQAESKTTLFEVRRNYDAFPFCFVEDHPNGHDYLLCGADYQGQTVLELDTGKRVDHLPKGAEKGVGWCWAHITASTEKTVLGVDGCFWACPYEVRFVDFSDPLNLPFLVLTELQNTQNIEALDKPWSEKEGVDIEISDNDGKDKHFIHWSRPDTAAIVRYWQSEAEKMDPKSHLLPDIQTQVDLARKKLSLTE
jgi:hypothetical protein